MEDPIADLIDELAANLSRFVENTFEPENCNSKAPYEMAALRKAKAALIAAGRPVPMDLEVLLHEVDGPNIYVCAPANVIALEGWLQGRRRFGQ